MRAIWLDNCQGKVVKYPGEKGIIWDVYRTKAPLLVWESREQENKINAADCSEAASILYDRLKINRSAFMFFKAKQLSNSVIGFWHCMLNCLWSS